MRFRRTPARQSPWEALDARRKMTFLAILVAAVICLNFATESWFQKPDEQEPQLPTAAPNIAAPSRPAGKGDEDDVLPPGAFRSLPEPAEIKRENGDTNSGDDDTEKPSDTANAAVALKRSTEVDPELLSLIRDDSLNIRVSERPAYIGILAQARDLPEQVLENAAIRHLNYTELFSEADRYRGQIITIEGRVKRLSKFTLSDNPEGLGTIYEAWIFTPDSGVNPYVFHATEISSGLKPGSEIDEQVRVTGYFFKRYQYPTAKGQYSAPMLLGKRLRWVPAVVVKQERSKIVPYVLLVLTFIGVALAVAVWRFSVADSQLHRQHMQRVRSLQGETVSQVEKVEPDDLSRTFQQLAAESDDDDGMDNSA